MTITAAMKELLMAQETDDVYLTLLTIDHADLAEPIRVVNDHVNHYSRGQDDAQDLTGNEHWGEINGSALYADGYLRGGLHFTDDDSWLEIGDHANLKITGALTVEAYIRLDEFTADGLVIRCGQDDDEVAYSLYVDDTGKLQYRWYNGTLQVEETASSVITLETWHHIALTRNTAGTAIKLYVDGVQVHSATGLDTPASGGVLTVGGLASGASAHKMRGTADEIRIWGTERTAQNLLDSLHEELIGDEDDLEGYWKLNEGNLYIAFNFSLQLPTDEADSPPVARLSIDNVSQEIAIAIRSITSPPSVDMEIVRAEATDVVEIPFTGFHLRNAQWDMNNVSGDLMVEDFMMEPYPSGTFTPSRFPGLF